LAVKKEEGDVRMEASRRKGDTTKGGDYPLFTRTLKKDLKGFPYQMGGEFWNQRGEREGRMVRKEIYFSLSEGVYFLRGGGSKWEEGRSFS